MPEEMIPEKEAKIFEQWRVIALSCVALITIAVGIANDRMELAQTIAVQASQIREYKFENAKLKTDLFASEDVKREFENKIRDIRATGHMPDSSVVWEAMRAMIPYDGWVTWSDLDSIFPYESGWGRDKRRGMFGEIRISQIDTATQKQILQDIGFDVSGFDPEDFGNPQTAAQYAVLYVALTKAIRGDFKSPLLRRYYYNGMHTTMDTMNTSRFDSVMTQIKERTVHGR